ncbi:MAG: hypothetical protein IPK64_21700 [bacterium]|nr:hypothetical protein [bacterium]
MFQFALFEGLPDPPPRAARPARPATVKPPVSVAPQAQYRGYVGDLATMADAWSDLHVWVLVRNLRLLASAHTEPEERDDILAWLEAPAAASPAAFSAQACLNLYDPRIDLPAFRHAVRRAHSKVLAARHPAGAAGR